MRILICDDEPCFCQELHTYISSFFAKRHLKDVEFVCFSSGNALLADNGRKDLVFLDIEMPDCDGIYIGNALKKENPQVIIIVVTSYMEYLNEAMRFQVFRYLSKPIDKYRLYANLEDALAHYTAISQEIAVETKQCTYRLTTVSIMAVEACGKISLIYTADQSYETIHGIAYWLDVLPKNCFFQTHRSFIVNLAHVKAFDHSVILFSDSSFHAYLSRRKYKDFKDAYLLFLEGVR